MSGILKMGEAASLAMHGIAYVAEHPEGPVSVTRLASVLHSSGHHLSKVFQHLAKAGLVRSVRGPTGGFILARPASSITLLEVYEAIEGPLAIDKCLLSEPVCGGKKCILGKLLKKAGKEVKNHLSKTKLSKLTGLYKSAKDGHRKKA